MKKILFATNNEAKIKRFKDSLQKNNIEIKTLKDMNINCNPPEENGKNAIENALIKAKYYYNVTGMLTIAMDDNLYIENIPEELQPGMYVRRVNGKRLTDEEMIEYYSLLAKKYGSSGKLVARWVYGMAVIGNGREKTYTWSKDDFYIVDKPSNIINPGYPLDSISVNKKINKYFTDITKEEKEALKEDENDVIQFIIDTINGV